MWSLLTVWSEGYYKSKKRGLNLESDVQKAHMAMIMICNDNAIDNAFFQHLPILIIIS